MERQTVTAKAFIEGDVYIDYPYERVKFRYVRVTRTVCQRWYGESETQIPHDSEFYNEPHSVDWAITREEYFRD